MPTPTAPDPERGVWIDPAKAAWTDHLPSFLVRPAFLLSLFLMRRWTLRRLTDDELLEIVDDARDAEIPPEAKTLLLDLVGDEYARRVNLHYRKDY